MWPRCFLIPVSRVLTVRVVTAHPVKIAPGVMDLRVVTAPAVTDHPTLTAHAVTDLRVKTALSAALAAAAG